MIVLENECLRVEISTLGGTLQSIRGKKTGIEYLWQGDRTYWGGRAPNLFPFVGRLYGGEYLYQGKPYPMKCHGFLGKQELTPGEVLPDRCVLRLADSPETREIYPFRFLLELEYWLEGRSLQIRFRAENRGEDTMYCGFGGHPGFNVPLEPGLRFEDYEMRFPTACEPGLVEFSPGVLTLGTRPYPLKEGRILPLERELFCFDAVVLTGCPREVTLGSQKGSHGVTLRFPDMPYVGFWQMPGKNAPFVCIEPWSLCPGREGVLEDISAMPDMTAIEPGGTASNRWSIEIF